MRKHLILSALFLAAIGPPGRSTPLVNLLFPPADAQEHALHPRQAQADSLFQAALREAAGRPLHERIAQFRKVLKLDYGHAPAHHQLARCYVEQGTPYSRQAAESEILEALKLDPENVAYNLTHADILWRRDLRDPARRVYERVLELDPHNADAAFGVARYHIFDAFRYSNMLALDEQSGVVRSLSSFGEKDRDLAVEYLSRALASSPDHRPSVARLCLLHFEEGRYDLMLKMTRSYLERHPDDVEVLLYHALDLQSRGNFPEAARTYQQALSAMPPQDRAAMESLEAVASQKERQEFAQAPPPVSAAWADTPDLAHFWGQRDPLLITPFNERRMEHYGRVAYAGLRFGIPEEGVPGWRTDQGRLHIRYGQPLGRTLIRPEIEISPRKARPYRETWTYEGFTVTFQNWDGLDHWRFEAYRDSTRRESVSDMNALLAHHPERAVDPYEGWRYNLPHQVAAFKGEGGKTLIEASYALPVDRTRYRRASDRYTVEATRGAFLLDSARVEVSRSVVSDPIRRQVSSGLRDFVYTAEEARWTVPPGRYTAVVEVQDHESGRIGNFHREVDASRFSAPGLCLSDILLAREVRAVGPDESSRAAFAVTPNPLRTCRTIEELAVYFEVYGLALDPSRRTAYEVAYTLSRPQPSEVDLRLFPDLEPPPVASQKSPLRTVVYRPGIDAWDGSSDPFRVQSEGAHVVEYRVEYQADPREAQKLTPELKRQLGIAGKPFSATVTLRYEGERTDEPRTLRVDLRHIQPGIQKLTLTVKDLQTGAQTSGWTLVRIVE